MSSMKLLLPVLCVAILGLAVLSEAEGAPTKKRPPARKRTTVRKPLSRPVKTRKPAARPSRKPAPPQARPKQVRKPGHEVLSPARMRALHTGTHHVHSTHGHKVFARLHRGKLAGMFLKGPKGNVIHGQRLSSSRRRIAVGPALPNLYRVSGDAHQPDLVTLADILGIGQPGGSADASGEDLLPIQNAGSGQIVFRFVIRFNGMTIVLNFCFPVSSVNAGGDDPVDPDDQTDPGEERIACYRPDRVLLDERDRFFQA
jgi:hypothetical protein